MKVKVGQALFLIFALLVLNIQTAKLIDTFNVLLPQISTPNQGRPVQIITSEGGCLQWTSSAPQILKVKGITDSSSQCHKKALLQLTHIGKFSSQIYVNAKNGNSDEINVPVRIRQLKKISIVTKSRMMNINQRQDLAMYGYDADQNRFTSLEGFRFKWNFQDQNQVLQKIPLKDSHLILPLQERKNIQNKGYQSDIIVVKGLKPGKVTVKVTCIQPGYEYIQDQIIISVHQRFEIEPSAPSYILVDSSFQYSLKTSAGYPIQIPKWYYKTLINLDFQITQNLLVKTPKFQSKTILKVEDIRTIPSYNASVQIFAKQPDQIKLIVEDYILVGQQESFKVQLYWNKKLLKGKSSAIKIQTSIQFNQEKMTMKSLKRQTITITAYYKGLKDTKTVHSILPIKALIPDKRLHLPVEETYQLKIIGGSGIYDFQSQTDHVSVSNGGLVFAKKQGNTKIRVSDKKKINHYFEIPVTITQILSISSLQYHKQLNKNTAGPVFISAYNPVGYYTQCDDQQMLLQISNYPHFEVLKKVQLKKQLQNLQKRGQQNAIVKEVLKKISIVKEGKQVHLKQFQKYVTNGYISLQQLNSIMNKLQNYGICSVHMLQSYKQFEGYLEFYLKSNINIKNKFKLRVYNQIMNQIQEGDKEYFVMTPLSSLQWKTTGGSFQWETPTKVFLNSIQIKQKYPIISCPGQSKFLQMKIEYKNQESSQLLFPVSQSKNLKIDCKFPTSIKIRFQQKNMHEHHTYVVPEKTVRGWLYPLDDKASQFYNSSNLIYNSKIQNDQVTINGNFFSISNPKRLRSNAHFSTFSIKNLPKQFAKVENYFIWEPAQMFQLNPFIQNSHILTMLNPKRHYQFNLTHSSQYIQTQCKHTISCTYSQQQFSSIQVLTQKIGNGTLKIRDKWLYGMPEINAILEVVQADQLKIQSQRNSIQVQRILPIKFWLYSNKRVIPIFQYFKSDIQLLHQAGISVISQKVVEKNIYNIKGQKSGNYRIQAQQHSPKVLISSNSIDLIVYDKISFNIVNLTQTYQNEVNIYNGHIIVPTNCIRKIKIYGGPSHIDVKYTQADQIKVHYTGNKKNKEIDIQGLYSGESSIKIQVIQPKQKITLAILNLKIKTSQIQKAVIYSLDDALIGAQFRMLPHLLIDQKPIVESQCQLRYEWLTSKQQGLKILDNFSNGGVNVTAVKQGQTLVQLKVYTRKKQVLLVATKNIRVHQNLDVKFPTLIGQQSQKITTNMLLPPNSGYQFQSHHSITKISQCIQNLLSIDSNKITTSRQKGIVSVKIKNNRDQTYNSFINVIVTDIKGLFIQNLGGKIDLQIGQQIKLNFYVMDMYGRQFYNNLINIEYVVISSNEDVLTATISKNKQQIILKSHKIGTAKLLIKQGNSNQLSLFGLLNTPHDIVQVQVGKLLQPVSPVYINKGGYVHFIYTGEAYQKWQAIQGKQNVKIDEENSKVYAKDIGESVVNINGLSTIIRVIQADKIVPLNKISQIGSLQQIQFQFLLFASYKQSQIRIQSFNQQYNHINHNLQVQCKTVFKNWFHVTTEIRQSADNQGKEINCIVKRSHVYPQDEQIPSHLILTVHVNKKILGSFQYPLHMMFVINKRDKNILLSKNKPSHEVRIKTSQRLQIDLIQEGYQNWYSSSFSEVAQIQSIKIAVPKQIDSNKHFRVGIYNPTTGQNQQIQVRYISEGQQHQEQQENSQGWFSGYQWTDFIIVIMGLVLLLILFHQLMRGGNQKYKVL